MRLIFHLFSNTKTTYRKIRKIFLIFFLIFI
nr:MAG TPA: hypothetical protein [Caudoviricetes sp.]